MNVLNCLKKPIRSEQIDGITIHRPVRQCCPLRAALYINRNVRRWSADHTLWDMREYDFSRLNYADISRFVAEVQHAAEQRKDRKTAILISSTIGLGITRMFQTLLDGRNTGLLVRSFDERQDALNWLND